jgi:hypothetical protein
MDRHGHDGLTKQMAAPAPQNILRRVERKAELMVRLAGIEPTTLGFGGQYSIH